MEGKICHNLRYSLEQLKLGSEFDMYSKIVDSVVPGPAKVNVDDVENTLGIDGEAFAESNKKRNDLISGAIQLSWKKKVETTISGPRPRTKRTLSLPALDGKCKLLMEDRNTQLHPTDLQDQFELLSKFGWSGSDGAKITLSQSDKWLRQAKVIDGWNVTTTDTAVAFRKISSGAIWLDYNAWRLFLVEFTSRKGLDMQ